MRSNKRFPYVMYTDDVFQRATVLWGKLLRLLSHKISIFDDWEAVTSGCYAHFFRRAANQVEDFAVWQSK